ncbi:MAG TPA: hypothetical protein VK157_15170, partial [Phycisphaerales bacterium]|nr:hypothetical protein [Phycisphaerales bacterium]
LVAGGVYLTRAAREPARRTLNEQYSVVLPEDSPIVHHFGSPVSMRPGTRDLYYTTNAPSGEYRVMRRHVEDGRLDSDGFSPGEAFGSVSPDGRRLVYWRAEGGEAGIRVRDLASGTDVAQRRVSNAWNGVAWVNDHTLAVAKFEEEDRMLVWDFAADRAWSPKNLGEGTVVQPAGVGDGRTLVMALHQSSAGNLSRSIFAWRDDLPAPVKLVDDAQMPKVFGGDVLLFYRDDGIWAVKLDIANLRTTGPEVSIIAGLSPDTDTTTCGMYDVTADGDLLYLPTTQTYQGAKLAWIDDKSQPTDILQVEAQMMALRLSPDARKIAYVAGGTTPDLFVHDLARGTSWLAAKGHVVLPVWTRDSESIIYQCTPSDGSGSELRRVRYDGSSPPELLFKLPDRVWAQPTDVTPDDKYLIVAKLVGPKDETDIVRYALDGSGTSESVFATHADRTNARISSDGTLIAYTSKESGEWAVYVQPYPSLDRKVRVSALAAFRLSWQRDSNTLFFRGASDVYSVDVTTSPKFSVSEPVLRFSNLPESRFDASPDGTRIVQSLPLKKYASLHELRIWLGAEQVIRQRLDEAAKAARR